MGAGPAPAPAAGVAPAAAAAAAVAHLQPRPGRLPHLRQEPGGHGRPGHARHGGVRGEAQNVSAASSRKRNQDSSEKEEPGFFQKNEPRLF